MNSRIYKYSLLAILVAMILLPGCSIQKRIKRADKKFAIGEYYTAADIYKSCYGRLSSKTEKQLKGYVAYKQGECYRILNNPRATNCYQNAIRNKYYGETSFIVLPENDPEIMAQQLQLAFLDTMTQSILGGWLDCTDENHFEARLFLIDKQQFDTIESSLL